jgi:predicted N-acetyltransferase YhbS
MCALAEQPSILPPFPNDRITVEPLRPEQAAACEAVGRALPAWFGIEEGLVEMRRAAETQPGFVATVGAEVVGFVTLLRRFPESWEVTWMAVAPAWHRRGVGRRLVERSVAEARRSGARLVLVKTLADRHPSPEYARTRAFYRAQGFLRLAVEPELWDPANPCLLLVLPL